MCLGGGGGEGHCSNLELLNHSCNPQGMTLGTLNWRTARLTLRPSLTTALSAQSLLLVHSLANVCRLWLMCQASFATTYGHSSHYCPKRIRLAAQQKVILIALPPNTTHLSPWTKGALKTAWRDVYHQYMAGKDEVSLFYTFQ